MMKKVFIFIVSILSILFLFLFLYINLPFEIIRKNDIEFGNSLILNIEKYRIKTGEIPDDNDWETLKEIGFKIETLGTIPSFKNNGLDYELIYLTDFDGPYLM